MAYVIGGTIVFLIFCVLFVGAAIGKGSTK